MVVRPETGLFFANAEVVAARIRAEVARRDAHAVVIDAETVPSIDISAVRALDALADDLERSGVRFAIARDVGQVRDLMAVDRTARDGPPGVPDRACRGGRRSAATPRTRGIDPAAPADR